MGWPKVNTIYYCFCQHAFPSLPYARCILHNPFPRTTTINLLNSLDVQLEETLRAPAHWAAFATFLVSEYKTGGDDPQFLAASTAVSYLRIVVNQASAKWSVIGVPESKLFYTCLTGGPSAAWFNKMLDNMSRQGFERDAVSQGYSYNYVSRSSVSLSGPGPQFIIYGPSLVLPLPLYHFRFYS